MAQMRRDRPRGTGTVTLVSARRPTGVADQGSTLRLRLRQPTPRHAPLSSRGVRRVAAEAVVGTQQAQGGQATGGGTARAANSIASSVACRALIKRPWQAPSVARLANKLGRGGAAGDVQPMMVEGPRGTVLAAVGDARAHSIAGDVLASCAAEEQQQQQQQQRGSGGTERGWRTSREPSSSSSSSSSSRGRSRQQRLMGSRGGEAQLTVRGGGGGSVGGRTAQTARGGREGGAHSSSSSSSSSRRQLARLEPAFGAVYEHRDSFGKPVVVGETDTVPELAFERDLAKHKALRDLASYKGGTAVVVWAGCGRQPEKIAAVRAAVAKDRAERNRCEKLAGPKPYSAHGF